MAEPELVYDSWGNPNPPDWNTLSPAVRLSAWLSRSKPTASLDFEKFKADLKSVLDEHANFSSEIDKLNELLVQYMRRQSDG